MSFTSKLFQNSARLWSGIGLTRGFHIMMRPSQIVAAACTPGQSTIKQQLLQKSANFGSLLAPVNSLIQQVAGFKVKGRLKRRCKDCYIVVRQERGYVICPTHPRHKQMAMKKRDYKSWILTHATQSKERGY